MRAAREPCSGLLRYDGLDLLGRNDSFRSRGFKQVVEEGAWVPGLWRLEVANVLQMSVRRRRHDAAFRDATLADLALLSIQVDTETSEYAWSSVLRLADRHTLTTYDAAYLELALRRDLPLATLDGDLREAARTEGVTLLG